MYLGTVNYKISRYFAAEIRSRFPHHISRPQSIRSDKWSESVAIIWVRDILSSAYVLLAESCEDTWQQPHNRPRFPIKFVCLKYYWAICTHSGVLILIKSLLVSVQKEPSDARINSAHERQLSAFKSSPFQFRPNVSLSSEHRPAE